jgi:hypothetical protein
MTGYWKLVVAIAAAMIAFILGALAVQAHADPAGLVRGQSYQISIPRIDVRTLPGRPPHDYGWDFAVAHGGPYPFSGRVFTAIYRGGDRWTYPCQTGTCYGTLPGYWVTTNTG